MSADDKHLYRFGEFKLDTEQNILLQGEKPLALTPKMFELLLVLVKNHGRIVGKDDLMEIVWADSFVEEGNLKFNINQLRKVLKDDARHPFFIETVARRGYRFIAQVEEVSAENDLIDSSEKEIGNRKSHRFYLPFAVGAIVLLGIIALGIWFVRSRNTESTVPILSANFSSEKLTTNGITTHAVISPDGKNVIYTKGMSGKQSIWLRQLESGSNLEIIPPSDDWYAGLALSPDGNFLYFVRRPINYEGQGDIYRVSIFGGVPQKIIGEAQGWISFSPDGTKISFARCYYRDDEYCSLWFADSADGKNEKKLAVRPRPFRIGDNQFSPDGKSIAFATGQSDNAANEFSLMKIDLTSGKEEEITAKKFFNIKNLAWLPNQNGWLITASVIPNKRFRIWQVGTLGEVEPVTNDSENYSILSLDQKANLLVSTQIKEDYSLYLFQTENPSFKQILAGATYAAFAQNGKIVFSSPMSGNNEIWSIKPDGSEQRQLTNELSDEFSPIVSKADNSVFFASNRTGAVHVWQMNADGSNQKQITKQTGGFPLFASADGNFLYYHHGLERTLWHVSLKTGEEKIVLNQRKNYFSISPDGLKVAFSEKADDGEFIKIVSLNDGKTIKDFAPIEINLRIISLKWTLDGKEIIYLTANHESANNILWRQSAENGAIKKVADLGDEAIQSFDFSSDNKTFAVVQGGWRHDAVLLKGLR